MELRKLYCKIGLGLAPHRLMVQFLDSVSLMLEQMGVRSHPERSLMPWSASMMLPHGGRGHYRTAHRVPLNTQLDSSASQAFERMRGDCCCKPNQLIPSAVPGPAVTAYEQQTFLSSSEAKGALGLPGDP